VSEFQYYRYHTGTGLIDSFPAPYSTFQSAFTISANGKAMFIRPKNAGALIEYSLDSLVVIAEHPIIIKEHKSPGWSQRISISPKNRYVDVFNGYLQIYSTSDYSRVFCDTVNIVGFGTFNYSGSAYMCGSTDSNYTETYIRKIDLRDNCTETRWNTEYGFPNYVISDRYISRFYLYLRVYGDAHLFQVFDIASDSVIFGKSFCPGTGFMVRSPDGQYIIFSQLGTLISDCPRPRYFTIFDTWSCEIYRQVDALVDSLGIVFPVGDLCITPDGKHLIGIGTVMGLFDYDLNNHEFIRHVADPILLPYSLECQKDF